MYDVYQAWLKQGGQQNRKLKHKSDSSWMDDLEGEEFQKTQRDLGNNDDDDQVWVKAYDICPEYDTCRYYQNSCKQGVDDSLTQYFECTQVERSNGNSAYIGPHCGADGITITLGVYSDENCYEYIGDGVNIANYLGFELQGDELAPIVTGSLIDIIPEEGIQAQKERYSENTYYDAELAEYYRPEEEMCIPCLASRQPYEVRGNVEGYEGQDDDAYGDDITELCENLYMVSARCDKHFRSYDSRAKMAKYAEAVAQEDLTCDFIESIVMGNYDEMGFVNSANMQRYNPETKSGMLADSMLWEQYGGKFQEVSPLQIFGLIASCLAFSVLAVMAIALNGSVRKDGMRWRPRSRGRLADLGSDNVTMGRSQSDMAPDDLSDRNRSYYAA